MDLVVAFPPRVVRQASPPEAGRALMNGADKRLRLSASIPDASATMPVRTIPIPGMPAPGRR